MRSVGKHILIVGDPNGMPVLLWQVGSGITTSVIGTALELTAEMGVQEHYAVLLVDETEGPEKLVELAKRIHRDRPLTNVVSLCDRCVPHAAAIAEELGLPGGHSYRAAVTAHHKGRWRDAMAAAGVEHVAHATVTDGADVVRFGEQHGWPVIVKPAIQAGSHGLTKVDGADQAGGAVEWARRHVRVPRDDIVVEEYIDGEHYIASTFSENGEHIVVTMARFAFDPPHMTVAFSETPGTVDAATGQAIRAHVIHALDAVGVVNGPASVEVRVGPDGPRTIECQLRTEGDDVWREILATTGVNLPEHWARQLIGRPVLAHARRRLDTYRRPRTSVRRPVYASAPGILRSMEGVVAAANKEGVVRVATFAAPGEPVRPPDSLFSKVAHVICEADTAAEAFRLAEQAARSITILTEPADHAEKQV
jgi:biotin carboxylase